jgi:hypothetical protein
MTMLYLSDSQLIGHCLAPLGELGDAVADTWTDEQELAIRSAIAQTLLDESQNEDSGIVVEVSRASGQSHASFGLVIYADRDEQGAKLLVTFGFRDAAVESALPLLGIILSIFTGKFGVSAVPQMAQIAKTFWKRLVVLRRPQDSDAIDTVQGLARIRARKLTERSEDYPTGAELFDAMPLDRTRIVDALSRLKSLQILEVARWGDQKGDDSHAGNQWRVRL